MITIRMLGFKNIRWFSSWVGCLVYIIHQGLFHGWVCQANKSCILYTCSTLLLRVDWSTEELQYVQGKKCWVWPVCVCMYGYTSYIFCFKLVRSWDIMMIVSVWLCDDVQFSSPEHNPTTYIGIALYDSLHSS